MKSYFTFTFLLLFNNIVFSQSVNFANTSIAIDGNDNDWNSYTINTEEYSKTSYSIANDHRYIYFLCKFKEKSTQMKVLRAGLEISLDTTNKNSNPVSIIFPYSSDRENNDAYSHSFTGVKANMDFETSKSELIRKSVRIKLNGMKHGLNDAMLNKINNINIHAAIDFDLNNNLIYELAIPINMIFDGNIKSYKYPFSFQYNILGLPKTSSDFEDNKYFENISFGFKSKLAIKK